MEGTDIEEIVRMAVRNYIAISHNDEEVRSLARIMAREALEAAIEEIDNK